jgi:hypothetical protein
MGYLMSDVKLGLAFGVVAYMMPYLFFAIVAVVLYVDAKSIDTTAFAKRVQDWALVRLVSSYVPEFLMIGRNKQQQQQQQQQQQTHLPEAGGLQGEAPDPFWTENAFAPVGDFGVTIASAGKQVNG